MPSSGRQVRSRPELRSTRARIVRRTIGVLFPIAVQDNAQKARSLRAWGAFTILALWRGAKGERGAQRARRRERADLANGRRGQGR